MNQLISRITKLFLLSGVMTVLAMGAQAVSSGQGQDARGDVSSLAWMSGTWTGVLNEIEMEETWTAPKGGMMLGVHRDVRDGRARSFEFMRIEQESGRITYWASPGGKPATPFRAVEIAGQRVVFENKEHDFPQRVIYWLGTDGTLHAKIEGMIKGKLESEEWSWKKQ